MSAETLVRKVDELRAESDRYEGYLRDMRLGRGAELARPRLRKGVFGFGWAVAEKATPMPAGMETEFYTFLRGKQAEIAESIRVIVTQLDSLSTGLSAPNVSA